MNLEKTPKSYRFKGGVIGGILGIISIIFYVITPITSPVGSSGIFMIPAVPVIFFWAITYFPICGYEGPKPCLIFSQILASILALASLIALGILIGWIVEKIKNR